MGAERSPEAILLLIFIIHSTYIMTKTKLTPLQPLVAGRVVEQVFNNCLT